MQIKIKKNEYDLILSPADRFSDVLVFLCNQKIDNFPHKVIVQNSKIPVHQIENLLLAIYQVRSFKKTDHSYFPQEVGDSSNFQHEYESWSTVPCYQRYVNHRMKIITDPEFLLIQWSKGFESFDANNNALLPMYPKSITNILFEPIEIKEVCRIILFEWCIDGLRTKKIPMTMKNAQEQFRLSFPLLHDLVYTDDGYRVLETVYKIIRLTESDYTQSAATRKKCLQFFKKMITEINNSKLKNHFKTNDRIGLYYVGMPNPKINGYCILTLFFSFNYFYFPQNNIYHVDKKTLSYILKLKDMYKKRYQSGIYQVDFDFKKKSNILVPITFDFFLKKNIQKINVELKKPNYTKFFDTLPPIWLFCKVNTADII